MQIKITGKELKVTEAINDYVERKMDRVAKYFEDAEADVVLKVEKTAQIAEIKVSANGEIFRAVTEDKDLYASIDKDIDILEGQIRKFKTKSIGSQSAASQIWTDYLYLGQCQCHRPGKGDRGHQTKRCRLRYDEGRRYYDGRSFFD